MRLDVTKYVILLLCMVWFTDCRPKDCR